MGSDQKIAAVPAASRTTSVSCGAYATDDSASDEKTASAFFLVSRSLISSSLWIGEPTRTRQSLPQAPRGSSRVRLASSRPAPRRAKPVNLGRVTRTTASPGRKRRTCSTTRRSAGPWRGADGPTPRGGGGGSIAMGVYLSSYLIAESPGLASEKGAGSTHGAAERSR